MSDHNKLVDYLANHPRMIGVLFTILLVLSQVNTVAAGNGVSVGGP